MIPTTKDAYRLLHRGAIALSRVESNGIRIDMGYLNSKITETEKTIIKLQKELLKSDVWTEWRKHYGEKANLGSREQLGQVFFKDLGFECKAVTKSGRFKTDESNFEGVDHPFVKNYFRIEKLKKAKTTYLEGIRRETIDGYLHPVFNLHLVQTYRSSSDSPNFQNIPVRNPEIGELIRRCFIPRKGNQLIEVDYSGIEVRIAACYHKDPVLIRDILTGDMHRDMSAECYILEKEQVDKKIRYCGKNKFVFPQFYGSYYPDCAKALWEAIEQMDLQVNGESLKVHLKKKGIHKLGECDPDKPTIPGTFEHHIKKVETNFWEKRYKVYAQWKKKWFRDYLSRGWFDILSGFRVHGVYRRNEVINYPVQGFAFHCLLESLIRLQKKIDLKRMLALIVGQIHDSILSDVPERERDDYLHLAKEITTKEIPRVWPSINVPLEIEAEASPVGASWFEKKGIIIP